MMIRILFMTVVVVFTASCQHGRPGGNLTLDLAFARVSETEMVQSLSRQYTNVIMMEDWTDEKGIHVYLGFNEGTHTTRHSSLLVKKDGTVWEEFTRPDYELDFRPVK